MAASKEFQDWIDKQSKAKQSKIAMLLEFNVSESEIRSKFETIKRGAPGREINLAEYGYQTIFSVLDKLAHKTVKVDGKQKKGERRGADVLTALVKNAKRAVSEFEKTLK